MIIKKNYYFRLYCFFHNTIENIRWYTFVSSIPLSPADSTAIACRYADQNNTSQHTYYLLTQKSFRNLIKSTQNKIVFTIFRWISVWFNKILERILCLNAPMAFTELADLATCFFLVFSKFELHLKN